MSQAKVNGNVTARRGLRRGDRGRQPRRLRHGDHARPRRRARGARRAAPGRGRLQEDLLALHPVLGRRDARAPRAARADDAAGAVRSRVRLHTPWGWIEPPAEQLVPSGVNLRREVLDPLIRETAAETPGVELILGHTVHELLRDGETVLRGARARHAPAASCACARGCSSAPTAAARAWPSSPASRRKTVPPRPRRLRRLLRRAAARRLARRLVLAARPRHGRRLPDRQRPHLLRGDAGQGARGRVPRGPRQGARRDARTACPTRRRSAPRAWSQPPQGKLDMTNVAHTPTAPGLALVGDAALAIDPLWGVGCGWALQSAEWLADSVSPALVGGSEPLRRAGSKRYRRRHARALRGHAMMIYDYAGGRKFNAARAAAVLGRDLRRAASPRVMEAFGTPQHRPGADDADAACRARWRRARAARSPRRAGAAAARSPVSTRSAATPRREASDERRCDAAAWRLAGTQLAADRSRARRTRARRSCSCTATPAPRATGRRSWTPPASSAGPSRSTCRASAKRTRRRGFALRRRRLRATSSRRRCGELGIERVHLVLHDFGGPFGLSVGRPASRRRGRASC